MSEDASAYPPQRRTLPSLRRAVQDCRGCELWRDATQAVFGEVTACKPWLEAEVATVKPSAVLALGARHPALTGV